MGNGYGKDDFLELLSEYYVFKVYIRSILDNALKLIDMGKPCMASKELKLAYSLLLLLSNRFKNNVQKDFERENMINEIKELLLVINVECLFDVNPEEITGIELCHKLMSLYITSLLVNEKRLYEKIIGVINKYCNDSPDKYRKELVSSIVDILEHIKIITY